MILENGAVPLSVLDVLVRNWIHETLSGMYELFKTYCQTIQNIFRSVHVHEMLIYIALAACEGVHSFERTYKVNKVILIETKLYLLDRCTCELKD